MNAPVARDELWVALRAATSARIGLPRVGSAIATREHLAFQLAHAQAQDAVHEALDLAQIESALKARGLDYVWVSSRAVTRESYLLRPDLGRRLSDDGRVALEGMGQECDLAFVVADGLSARAVQHHAVPLIDEVARLLHGAAWRIGPVVIARQARVAIGDEIGQLLGAHMVVMLIGERPGLTSPDSLGAYITWAPVPGRHDAERNCLSNIRPEGMGYAEAAQRLVYLCSAARQRKLTGVGLKDETVVGDSATVAGTNFIAPHASSAA